MVEQIIDEFVSGIDLSLWFAMAGLVLIVGEAFIPGGAFVVVGTGLLAAGTTGLLFEINSLLPLTVLTAVYGTAAFAGFRRFEVFGERGEQTSEADSLRGEEAVVKERVTSDDGRVKLRSGGFNPYYEARTYGDPIPVGSRVRVVDPSGGNVLEVEPVPEETVSGSSANTASDEDTSASSESESVDE